MRIFFVAIFVCFVQFLFAQNTPMQLNAVVLPIDTMNIQQGIQKISEIDTIKKDSTIQTHNDSIRSTIMQLFDEEENINYNIPISKTDSIIVAVADSIATIDSLQVTVDTLQVNTDTVIAEEIKSPENISLSNVTLIDNKIYKNNLKDLSIENSTIISLTIDDSNINTATITSSTITKLIIKNATINDFLIEDSAIGELIIENSKIIDFETINAFIKKQSINTSSTKAETE